MDGTSPPSKKRKHDAGDGSNHSVIDLVLLCRRQQQPPEKTNDDQFLLHQILSFIDDASDFARLLKVNTMFRRVASTQINQMIQQLVGAFVRPTLGQTPCELLRAAQTTVRPSSRQKWLLPWKPDPSLLHEGYRIGLLTEPHDASQSSNRQGEVIARIPCGGGVFVPAVIHFDQANENRNNSTSNVVRLPPKFLHMNAYPSGAFLHCANYHLHCSEQTLTDTLLRIRDEIDTIHAACPHNAVSSNLMQHGSMEKYEEYKTYCLNIFRGYHLTQPDCFPDLTVVEKAATLEVERLKNNSQT